ncbi:MAG: 2-oxo acid dehydrogenase subunit E2 [Bacteroidetes bacterium]|nr:MAG: 2-oxo acid dehydrogenase subunit E2 [Bacteroidota bacterium]
MARIEIPLPTMGEGVIEATLTKWLVNIGDHVEEDDSLVEVATDKVDSEIPAPQAGIVKELLVNEGEVSKVGTPLLILETDDNTEVDNTLVLEEVKRLTIDQESQEPEVQENKSKLQTPGFSSLGKFLSPLVRSIATEEAIPPEDIENIQGTGKNGRITKNDLINYIESRKTETSIFDKEPVPKKDEPKTAPKVIEKAPVESKIVIGESDEIIEMDRIRKIIADRMVASKRTSPHVTSFIEADVTNMVLWRNKIKEEFFQKENQKITFTPLFIEAASKALRDFPMINISVEGDHIIKKKNINIGMATALPSGNLIVPVIKNTDEKNLIGLVKSVNDLANRARKSKLSPDEISGGTFTITNFGTFQNLTGTPIINQPEVAILGVGAIIKKPAVIETETGDAIAIRHLMILSLSYDHRVVDGALGGMFLKRVAEYLENFDLHKKF